MVMHIALSYIQCKVNNDTMFYLRLKLEGKALSLNLCINFDATVREYISNELIVDFKSMFVELVMTTSLQKIKPEDAKIYTMEIFKEVRNEIKEACALNVVERIDKGMN
ncbi:hypothetical protein L6164_013338 [Bauhinia variegata]|uniref:Uncharacterized protein n=1 Tax=Bauhinia variegata TaxID=167791 RepID=A0ACB9PBT8_BAUVA|nr:hypothetical protein L6164_013338 [Bauhinia variegata]